MTPRPPRPRVVAGARHILHAEGDPWNGCVVYVSAHHTPDTVRCSLPKSQRRYARAHFSRPRLLATNDLF